MQDAIISSLYRFGASPLPPPDGQTMSLEAIERRADQLVATHHVSGGRMFDLCRLGRDLLHLLLARIDHHHGRNPNRVFLRAGGITAWPPTDN